MILLDTHTLVWLIGGSERLGSEARRLCDEHVPTQGTLVSAISFWEIAILVRKNRLELPSPPSRWRDDVLRAGLTEVPLDGRTAIEAQALPDFHADPADQLIVAAALRANATLVTADERILQWPGQLARQDARL